MAVKKEDFVKIGPAFLGGASGRNLDYEKMAELPMDDFDDLYRQLMSVYRDEDGWWANGKFPRCSQCGNQISGPERLRRYYGRTLDPICFRVTHRLNRDKEGEMQRYWDRVAELD